MELANALKTSNKIDQAIECYRKVIKMNPQSV